MSKSCFNIISNTLFRSTGDKDDEQNNLIAESKSNDIEETVTQSPMVTKRCDIDAQRKVFVSLTLPYWKILMQ